MKYSITYECRSDKAIFRDSFEFEYNEIPKKTDPHVIEFAMRMSTRFIKDGMAGLEVLAIVPREK